MSDIDRRYPRFRINLRVRVHGMSMLTNKVLLSGAQVSRPAMKYEVLSEKMNQTEAPVEPTVEQVRLAMTGHTKNASDRGDEYLLGAQFARFGTNSEAKLKDFLITQGGAQGAEVQDIAHP